MKKKNLVVLLISIIFPLLVATFIGMYSYGSFGNYDKNQDAFLNSMFNEEQETTTSIENYVKVSSSHYVNVATDVTVYSDYLEKTEVSAQKGTFTIDNKFTIAPYVYGDQYESKNEDGSTTDKTFVSTSLFLYNVNYNNVTPSKLYFICVQGTEDEDYDHLLAAIEQFDEIWKEEANTGSATVIGSRQSPFPIYDIHAVLEDDAEDEDKVPTAYSFTPNRNYQVTDDEGVEDTSIQFENLSSCSFAIIETTENDETNVIASGLIKNIKRNFEALEKTSNVEKGFGMMTGKPYSIKALQNAGYTAYILPTLAWQCGLALLISGFVSFLFYMTWTYEEPNAKKKLKSKK